METVFDLLPTVFKRGPGHLMTAASAATVLQGLLSIDPVTLMPPDRWVCREATRSPYVTARSTSPCRRR